MTPGFGRLKKRKTIFDSEWKISQRIETTWHGMRKRKLFPVFECIRFNISGRNTRDTSTGLYTSVDLKRFNTDARGVCVKKRIICEFFFDLNKATHIFRRITTFEHSTY